ncbi:MAG: efflux RND transporter periplasmic adaptor subunit [Gammaproteobacteria bacterium]|nr:efflux RND transporter periplasmic adaptor subunit [Gammaproteobacteria bacterium]
MPALKYIFTIATIAITWIASPTFAQTMVKADTLSNLSITVERSVPAQALGLKQTDVSSQIIAEVSSLPLLVGQRLEDQQHVGTLNCVDNKLSLKAARAEFRALDANRVLVEKQLSRLEKLRLNRNASEEQINQKQAEMSSIGARLSAQSIAIQIAERQIEKCQIIAPFGGVITQIHSEKGDFVTPGTLLFSMVDPDNIELDATLTNSQLAQLLAQPSLYFLFEQNIFPVEIRTALPLLDAISQTRQVRLTFPHKKPLPGARGRLQWVLLGNILPSSLVIEREKQQGIFVVETNDAENQTATFIQLENITLGQPAVVDLDKEALIITDGRFSLNNGDRIVLE